MSNKVYDILRVIGTVVLPAAGTLYAALAKIWGFPLATEVVGTISAATALTGAILKWSSSKYHQNKENTETDEDEE